MEPFKRTVKIGTIQEDWDNIHRTISIKIELRPCQHLHALYENPTETQTEIGQCLSITGEVGKGKFCISCGQIDSTLKEAIEKIRFTTEMTREKLRKLLTIWNQYHLNDMQGGYIHQTAIRDERQRKGETIEYGELTKIPEFKKCSVCGYSYGHA